MNPTLKQAHLQTAQCQPAVQSLQKSLLCQRRQKLFLINSPTLQKNKNTPTHRPTITADNDR